MATSSDTLRLKTDAELRFFVDNPTFYQAELVEAARRELRRRYPAAALPQEPQFIATEYDQEVPRRPVAWRWLGAGAAVLLVAGLGFWGKGGWHHAAPAAPAKAKPVAPLETAISAPPLPTFDTEQRVEQALTRVPATEKANAQHLSQYQAIARRFWAAQQPSAYLIGQAQQGKPNPLFRAQAELVLNLWSEFDRALTYSYSFDPVMADHFRRMKTVAQQQRDALTELLNDATANRPLHLETSEQQAAQQGMPRLLAPLETKND